MLVLCVLYFVSSENKLVLPADMTELVTSFSHITAVFLNRMEYDWPQVLECSPHVGQGYESLKYLI